MCKNKWQGKKKTDGKQIGYLEVWQNLSRTHYVMFEKTIHM